MNAPSKAMELKAAISAVLAGMTAFWGWTGWLVVIWLAAMILDYATGSWAALSTGSWDSAVARAGLWHKLGSIVAMLVALLLDVALSAIINYGDLGFDLPFTYKTAFLPLVAIWYIVTELGSIAENAGALGAPMPQFLMRAIAALRAGISDRGGGDGDGGGAA